MRPRRRSFMANRATSRSIGQWVSRPRWSIRARGLGILIAAAASCSLAIPQRALAQHFVPPSGAPASAQTPPAVSNLQGINDYVDSNGEPVQISQLGIMVRDGHATVDDGEKISGVS